MNGWTAWCLMTVASPGADPGDEKRFTLSPAIKLSAHRLLPVEKITSILTERLDRYPKSLTTQLAHHIKTLGELHHFDPVFILAVIEVESSFRIKVMSDQNAVGLMQVQLGTAQFVWENLGVPLTGYEDFTEEDLNKSGIMAEEQLFDPFLNTAIGVAYFAWLREHYKHQNSPYFMLAAYNLGPAKLDGLLTQDDFHPVETLKYFLAIQHSAQKFRFSTVARQSGVVM